MNRNQFSESDNAETLKDSAPSQRPALNLEIEQLEDRIAPTMLSLAGTYSYSTPIKYDAPMEQVSLNFSKITFAY